MRQRLGLPITIVVVIGVLIGISALSQVSKEKPQDSELEPNRSTYHSGPTGTRALYDFLSESGYKVMRWREIPQKLLSAKQTVQTFVIVGPTPLDMEEEEATSLISWVERGGRLVLVDREPASILTPASGNWNVSTQWGNLPSPIVDPGNTEQMIENVKALQPVQPTLLTWNVENVMPSRFASQINVSRVPESPQASASPVQSVPIADDEESEASPSPEETEASASPEAGEDEAESAPTPMPVLPVHEASTMSPAPVVHLTYSNGALLVDYPVGRGRIIVLSDPYIFSNGGISLRDNLQLAINMLSSGGGLIAFDEYHHGKAVNQNAFVSYFAGTPVIPILGQVTLLILVLLWTRGRRFGRPLPLAQVDRRSSLEFVASMAELQQRARAFDLALENIYARTRRVLARYAGTDYSTSRSQIASLVAARSSVDAHQLEVLMRQCEDAINGEPISERQTLLLAKRLRDIEGQLGMRMRSRDIRQATQ